ncbi:MAG: helix-turn-helix transcriptional regulator [Clostridia bacterium]|jgi:transcriptional regulator with XRE-family HTH domain|nr:helix-turn-helix transcriptional regulator [Clostridia bacterium]
MNNFGNKLRYFRKKMGFTQKELAKKLNISASTIGMYEQGRREPDFKILNNICNVLSLNSVILLSNNKSSELNEAVKILINLLDSLSITVNKNTLRTKTKKQIIEIIRNNLDNTIEKIYANFAKNSL